MAANCRRVVITAIWTLPSSSGEIPGMRQWPVINSPQPPAIRNLTKNQLYLMLSETYLLPSIESKGINRTYLVGVYTDQNYRLNLLEYKRFEAELTPSQQKKTNLVNLAYILRKLNALLVEENRRPLGFPDFIIPEEGGSPRSLAASTAGT